MGRGIWAGLTTHMGQVKILRLHSHSLALAQDDDLLVETFDFAFNIHAATQINL